MSDTELRTIGLVGSPVISEVPRSNSMWTLLTLCALMAFASISTDLYLPAMPAMRLALHASAGEMALTISAYLVGVSLGQLFWGPMGDRLGRRLPIAIGLVLFIIGSAGCALSVGALEIITWRAVQAVGACASVVLARAVVRDLYVGDQAAQMMSILMTVMFIAPLVGPSVGGLILQVASWRMIFWLLVAVGFATLVAVYRMPETLPFAGRNREPMLSAFSTYAMLMRHRRLIGYAGAGGFFYGGIYAYIAGTPFAYIDYHHVPPQVYGLLFGLGIIGVMGTNLLNARLVRHFGADRLMWLGVVCAATAGVAVALCAVMDWGGLVGLVLPLFLFVSSTGFIAANALSGALNLFPQSAGSVSALVGATQSGVGILASALVGTFANGTPAPMGFVIALCGIGSVCSAALLVSDSDP